MFWEEMEDEVWIRFEKGIGGLGEILVVVCKLILCGEMGRYG